MKKSIFTITALLFTILLLSFSTSCRPSSSKKEDATSESENTSGEKWLKSIFQCDNGSNYCFPDEEKVCTKRYYEFFIESLSILEYPDFETEVAQIVAQKAYKNKWKDIYPLDVEVLSPFGRGNGLESGQKLENVSITSLPDTKYTVIINYGEGIKTTTELTLVPNGNSFLIDYMKSDFIE